MTKSEQATGEKQPSEKQYSLAALVGLYTLARLALVAVIFGIIYLALRLIGQPVPLIVIGMFSLIIALPLAFFVFQGLRKRVSAGIALHEQARREHKVELHKRLRGE